MNIYVYTLNFILFDHKQNFSVPTQFFLNAIIYKPKFRMRAEGEYEEGLEGLTIKAYHNICQTWWRQCYGVGIYGCQWIQVTSVY